MADQGTSDPRMSEHLRQMLASMREAVLRDGAALPGQK